MCGSTTRMCPPTGICPAVVKLTFAKPVKCTRSVCMSKRSTPVRSPTVIASVDTSDALSMMLPELSYVVIDVSDAAPTCLVGVVTCEIVNATTTP